MKQKLIIVGAGGRMGHRIISLAVDGMDFSIAGAVDTKGHPDIGKDVGLIACGKSLQVKLDDKFPAAAADVVIDFSQPQAVEETLSYCLVKNCPLVLGTTGLSSQQQEKIRDASKKIAIVYSTNMSVGMNVLFSQAGKIASMLKENYDIEIVEQHHRFKKDAPSGSALTLAENICRETGREYPGCIVYGRQGKEALRKKGEIGIHSIRAGDITGIHSVIFSTEGETISLNHTAHNRDCFARGALRAAAWIVGRKPALYSMADVLGVPK